MKALILAAGYGTRLLPHTKHIPKPLFPINGQPLIDRTIYRLIDSGITGIIINVHHLHQQITSFIQKQDYPIPVTTCFEEKILGTGGAIKNVSEFFEDSPFLMINSDILTDIDLMPVYEFHRQHNHPATLVMHDYPDFNKVWVDENKNIIEFSGDKKKCPYNVSCQAFTGIQVLDPQVLEFIPENRFFSIIDAYRAMTEKGLKVKAYTSTSHYWKDIGTPDSFSEAVSDKSAPKAFSSAFGSPNNNNLKRTLLAGDGSDRRWYRISSGSRNLILGDHGINAGEHTGEVDSFINIGQHLFNKNIPVPEIFHFDSFSGQVYVQDLGDTNLQEKVLKEPDKKKIIRLYKQVIDQVLYMSIIGSESFNTSWTFQTEAYDRQLILEKECRYFVDAFLNNYLKSDVCHDDLKAEFECLADLALENAVTTFMHRDLQSRNIMVSGDDVFFIDFQGARLGPIQYDLASLLTDPYVNLDSAVQKELINYSTEKLGRMISIEPLRFLTGYKYCSITRILQSLGAFAFLSKVKGKLFFEQYIPVALNNLFDRLQPSETEQFPLLTQTVKNALILLNSQKE